MFAITAIRLAADGLCAGEVAEVAGCERFVAGPDFGRVISREISGFKEQAR